MEKRIIDCLGEPGLYAQDTGRIRERPSRFQTEHFSERHIQCIWYDPELRPTTLATHDGEALEVEHPGSWNLEAGPDFLGCVVHVGPDRRRLQGDCEIHLSASGWKEHGHARDPRFSNVRLHVTWHPGSLPAADLPPGTLQVALQPFFRHRTDFSFDSIDLAKYPYDADIALSPLREKFSNMNPDEQEAFLDAAGTERIRRKAEHQAELIHAASPSQALYEEMMAALGYKGNKTAFRTLARKVPLQDLRDAAAGDPVTAYAILLGVSGLIPNQPPQGASQEERKALRHAWDIWWKTSERWNHRAMAPHQWVRSGLRPPSQPERRLKAAATLFTRPQLPDQALQKWSRQPARVWIREAIGWLDISDDSWWVKDRFREGPPAGRSLLGKPRASAIITNVLVPFAAAMGLQDVFTAGVLRVLPPEPMNAIIQETAHALFGPDHSNRLYRSALRRQGLIQIFYDYGLRGKS